jgi:tRNA (uracil-5-)-methyltransferase TRM9
MNQDTIHQLNQLNQQFYSTVATDFSATRQGYWSGWEQLINDIDFVQQQKSEKGPLRFLDLGCGNGRFERFLSERINHTFSYVGIDNNAKLLASAKSNVGKYIEQDVITEIEQGRLEKTLRAVQPHIITAFGLLHHIPSKELRRALLETMSKVLPPNGLCVVTAWQFIEIPQLVTRALPHKQVAGLYPELNIKDLEKNDFFLTWERGEHAIRYCHLITETKCEELVEGLFSTKRMFRADGKSDTTNIYVVGRK